MVENILKPPKIYFHLFQGNIPKAGIPSGERDSISRLCTGNNFVFKTNENISEGGERAGVRLLYEPSSIMRR